MSDQDIITPQAMRALEHAAIEGGAVTGLELMERAGQGVVEAIYEHWPELHNGIASDQWEEAFGENKEDASAPPLRAVVLCGPGNNGGDGFVVARLLKAKGWDVEAFFYGDRAGLGSDADANYKAWAASNPVFQLGFPELDANDATHFWERTRGEIGTFLIVDALFGLGLGRPLTALEPILNEIEHNQFCRMDPVSLWTPRCVAIDIPSGVDSDTGEAPMVDAAMRFLAVCADLTVTFHRRKPGHLAGHAKQLCGKVVVKDIGL